MKTEIVTDLKNATFQAKREFKADIALVWRAWTEAELLDQWWAPKPWKCETRTLDFKTGGKWIYEMVGPNGEKHTAVQIYEKIETQDYFSGTDAFSDEEGNINEELPVAKWKNTFVSTEKGTLVITFAQYPTEEALETVIKMGMAEGFNLAQDNLEEILLTLKK
jgi:uncharacterized protein YndB with AHSA1/START domain